MKIAVLLVDSDSPLSPPIPDKHNIVRYAIHRGAPVVLYPHGAMPVLDYDGIRKFSVPISLQLLPGEGHAEIYRRAGLTHRFSVVGWMYGFLKDSISKPVEHLVFAPIHPWANGRNILPFHKAFNQVAYQAFVEHPAPKKTVRMFGEDEPNGVVSRHEGIEYTRSDLGSGVELIDSADAVVSYGTFAYRALAMGKPVAMIDGYPAYISDDGNVKAKHIDDYSEYARYPAVVGDAPLDELFAMDVTEWKRLFVGESLNMTKLFCDLRSLRPNRETRRRLANGGKSTR